MASSGYSRAAALDLFLAARDRAETPRETFVLSTAWRLKGSLEKYWQQWVDKPQRLPPAVTGVLTLAAAGICLSEKNEPWASVNEWVNVTRDHSNAHAGLANAVLRKMVEARERFLAKAEENFPEWIVRHVTRQRGEEVALRIFDQLTSPPKFVVGNRTDFQTVTSLGENRDPVVVQNLSSRFVVEAALSFLKPGMRFLDLCAGRGGKYSAITGAMPGLKSVATDIDPKKTAEGCTPWKQVLTSPEPFDVILVDAPCTASGTWAKNPSGKWRCTPEILKQRMKDQDGVLKIAREKLAAGGIIVYAVCSVFDEEGEGHFQGTARDLPLSWANLHGARAAQTPSGGLVIEPGDGWEGFYIRAFSIDAS